MLHASVPWRARRLSLIVLALAALLVAGAPPASAATLRVCPSGCAFDNLPDALAAAANGDTIRIAAGNYATGGFVINKNVRLRGAGADQTTILGDGRRGFGPAVLVGTGGSATIEGVTISSVFFEPAPFGAGGILNLGTLILKASTVTRNSSSNGGGIDNAGTLTLTGSTVSGNAAVQGGGIFNGGTLTLTGSTVSDNTATIGGGIFNTGTLTLKRSTVSGNVPDDCFGC